MPESNRDTLVQQGRALRKVAARSSLGTALDFERDAMAILSAQNASRLPELIPVRWERMSESAFAFFRGAAAVMAHDLAKTPVTGLTVLACGDAHLSNFGFYASPERTLVFDLNDFDETSVAPWEWDVERLVASFAIASRVNGSSLDAQRAAARAAASAYGSAIQLAAEGSALDIYHSGVTAEWILQEQRASQADQGVREQMMREVKRVAKKAEGRTSEQAMNELTITEGDGQVKIIDQGPLVLHPDAYPEDIFEVPGRYKKTAAADVAALMNKYRVADAALKVVGVGSVGTRCFILLLLDSAGSPLFLQAKEATASVLEPYAGPCGYDHMGERVVRGQQIMQSVSDPFLGWASAGGRQYYIRQFRDMKGSFQPRRLSEPMMIGYAELCGVVLARAHAQSCEPSVLAGYLGKGPAFETAMTDFAIAYADQNDRDYQSLMKQISSGRITAAG